MLRAEDHEQGLHCPNGNGEGCPEREGSPSEVRLGLRREAVRDLQPFAVAGAAHGGLHGGRPPHGLPQDTSLQLLLLCVYIYI